MYILGYNCVTAAGFGADKLMDALYSGRDCSQSQEDGGRICFIPRGVEPKQNFQQRFQSYLHKLWSSLGLSAEITTDLKKTRVAFLFSSTKGIVEDYVWTEIEIRNHEDPFHAVYSQFTDAYPEINWTLKCNISNACSSSHLAFEYAQDLFAQDRIDYAFVFASDLIGPFIYKGFFSLKVASLTTCQPFAASRDGLQLGDAAALILLSKDKKSGLKIADVASETEGTSITRPSMSGEGLFKAISKMSQSYKIAPDLIVAHGTGTRFNDQSEDLAFQKCFTSYPKVPVTGTKWAIGHTLGASGAIDLIAACELLKNKKSFSLQNTPEKDPTLKMNYLTKGSSSPEHLKQVLISSLGFGGVHAALLLEKEDQL
ncbi:MAG: beta-ketoacyl synthase N-terminal-like domain-containing protein [Pseudobdellovibrionaceae bacterium]